MQHRFSREDLFPLFVIGSIFALIASTACGPIYIPAIRDTNHAAHAPVRLEGSHGYAGLDVSQSIGYNQNESNGMMRGHVSWATGTNVWRAVADASFYSGAYEVTQAGDPSLRGMQSYVGFGLSADYNAGVPIGDFSLGGGITADLNVEYGPYTRLWRDASTPGPATATLGLYLYMSYKLGKEGHIVVQTGSDGGGYYNLQVDLGKYLFWGGFAPNDVAYDSTAALRRVAAGIGVRFH
jgi:hypothetical protein